MIRDPDNILSKKRPDLCKEWDYEKNYPLTPDDVTCGSQQDVWWKCKKGHSYKAKIKNRISGSGCPYCSNAKVCIDNCLATLNPELAKEWDYEKNYPLTPFDVTCGSEQKVYWICDKNHSWKASVKTRNNGSKCPYCQHRKVCIDNCLATLNPELAKEWDYEKNYPLTPFDVMLQSTEKRHWKCKEGHECERSPSNRFKNPKCPICVIIENSFPIKYPHLLEEWDYEKNKGIDPYLLIFDKKVYWKCKDGHSWMASVTTRLKTKCPYCSRKKVCIDNCLATLFPQIAKEWNYEKNGDLTPYNVMPQSHKKVNLKCKDGHEWKSTVYNRTINNGCPICNGKKYNKEDGILSISYPHLLEEWDYEKNKGIDPNKITYGSKIVVGWICKKFKNHKWSAPVNSRTNKNSDCPYCGGKLIDSKNCLAFINPKLAKEWHPIKNGKLTPYDVFPMSSEIAWWIDKKGHEWKATIASRSRGSSCPYCSGHRMSRENCLANVSPHLLEEWDYEKNKGLSPYDVSYGSRSLAHWKCKKKGHLWVAAIKSRSRGSGCPKCRGYVLKDGRHFSSLLDIWFFKQLKKQKKKFLYNQVYPRVGNKKLGKKGLMRYDFYLPDDKKYIEVTSYAPKYCVDIKQYRSYLRTIKKKKKYVEEVLGCEFQFVQKRLTKEEIKFIKKYIE